MIHIKAQGFLVRFLHYRKGNLVDELGGIMQNDSASYANMRTSKPGRGRGSAPNESRGRCGLRGGRERPSLAPPMMGQLHPIA